jgi:methionyl-tRNA synthetase
MAARFAGCFDLAGFSLNRAAEAITDHLARLDRWHVTDADAGDFCFEVGRLLRAAAPILIDLAATVPDIEADPTEVTSVIAAALPRLEARR